MKKLATEAISEIIDNNGALDDHQRLVFVNFLRKKKKKLTKKRVDHETFWKTEI